MSFTGKATYSKAIPELAEDVSDLVAIVSPYETPLLDALGDPMREATSTHHEWLEDNLLPNKDTINDNDYLDPAADTNFAVEHSSRFRVGDQIQMEGSEELMLVTDIDKGDVLTVVRGYADTTAEDLADNQVINIIGNAALEGADKPGTRFINRSRCGNYTQIFTATVEAKGTYTSVNQLGIADEMDYQKQERLREMLRDLENKIINGGLEADNSQNHVLAKLPLVRRKPMKGIIQHLSTNVFHTGDSGFPASVNLDEAKVNYVLKKIWEDSNSNVDLIVVGGFQKRKMNAFCSRSSTDIVSIYESDYGICRIVTTRWMPQDSVLFLDSSRVDVLPLIGQSFHYKPLASDSEYACGQLIGEYTLEIKNEAAHGLIKGLTTC